MNRQFWVYILASRHYGTLYTGVTSGLVKRIYEHKSKVIAGFTKAHTVDRLVYFEEHTTAETAIIREKQIKKWNRDWKINLIEKDNPNWQDLYTALI